jgi:hypothetical protein
MSTDRGEPPNDPYRPAQPDDAGSTTPPGTGPTPSGYEASPSGYETPGTGDRPVPAQPPYAPYGQQPYPYAQQPAYGSPPPSAGTDGFAIAALVTGILMMTVVPIVLGIVALNRINRSGQEGRGLAIAGIVLGAISVVFWLVGIILAVGFFTAWERTGFETYGLGAIFGA